MLTGFVLGVIATVLFVLFLLAVLDDQGEGYELWD